MHVDVFRDAARDASLVNFRIQDFVPDQDGYFLQVINRAIYFHFRFTLFPYFSCDQFENFVTHATVEISCKVLRTAL